MPTIFGYVTTSQLAGHDDPVEILRSAPSRDALLRLDSFSPGDTSGWARAGVAGLGQTRDIINDDTGLPVEVAVCALS